MFTGQTDIKAKPRGGDSKQEPLWRLGSLCRAFWPRSGYGSLFVWVQPLVSALLCSLQAFLLFCCSVEPPLSLLSDYPSYSSLGSHPDLCNIRKCHYCLAFGLKTRFNPFLLGAEPSSTAGYSCFLQMGAAKWPLKDRAPLAEEPLALSTTRCRRKAADALQHIAKGRQLERCR